ncbi:hypothetical protein SCBWM1_gp49 [Synechococcus phage S-CBWM1]|uniref:Uncharacterized protein n=1 Tax=Synechococcus phage S-CBWM1 TaxID=2053653 RepID=A0A3G1L3H5_9CAUD|nr:hypothetical protein HOU61_gp148 [Synechococcus phage S-CBWM1]ATW62733.1 hypothetical protein SCBWM1_gp49 [Synechococcus phage S-CBWM1]
MDKNKAEIVRELFSNITENLEEAVASMESLVSVCWNEEVHISKEMAKKLQDLNTLVSSSRYQIGIVLPHVQLHDKNKEVK